PDLNAPILVLLGPDVLAILARLRLLRGQVECDLRAPIALARPVPADARLVRLLKTAPADQVDGRRGRARQPSARAAQRHQRQGEPHPASHTLSLPSALDIRD